MDALAISLIILVYTLGRTYFFLKRVLHKTNVGLIKAKSKERK